MSAVSPQASAGAQPPADPAFYIAGPTGVGKSDIAVAVAQQVGGEIVGADAFQLYAGLPILTAQPSAELLRRVPHHLVGEVPLSSEFSLAEYLPLARARIAEIRARGPVPLVVGGTGLYLRGLTRGLADLPAADPDLRRDLEHQPLEALQARLRQLDPAAATAVDLQNPRRVIRALEVCLLTGWPFSATREQWREGSPAAHGVVLLRDRPDLYQRIDRRVEAMFADAVVEEIANAAALSQSAGQVLGYSEILQMQRGETTREACISAIQQKTRQYAKRQETWFRREPWLEPLRIHGSADEVAAEIVQRVRSAF